MALVGIGQLLAAVIAYRRLPGDGPPRARADQPARIAADRQRPRSQRRHRRRRPARRCAGRRPSGRGRLPSIQSVGHRAGDRRRPAAVSSSGEPNGSRVPWTNRHGTSSRGRCSTRSVVRLARRVQRIGDQHEPGAPAAGLRRRRPPSSTSARPSTGRRARAGRAVRPRHRLGRVLADRWRAAPAPGRAPCGRPCGRGSRRARTGIGATAVLDRHQDWVCVRRRARARGQQPRQASCQQDPPGLAEVVDLLRRAGLVAAVVGVHLAQPRRGTGSSPRFLVDLAPCPAGSRAAPAPTPAGRPSSASARARRAGEVGDERRADRAPPAHRLVQHGVQRRGARRGSRRSTA